MRPSIWSSQKDSLQRARKRKYASCKSPSMDLSRRPGLGTLNLTNRSSHLDLSNALMRLVYKRSSENVVVFYILYVDDILLIGNNVGTLSSVKLWLSNQFEIGRAHV